MRASQYSQIKIMYPMISSINEIRKADAILECKKELDEQGKFTTEYKGQDNGGNTVNCDNCI